MRLGRAFVWITAFVFVVGCSTQPFDSTQLLVKDSEWDTAAIALDDTVLSGEIYVVADTRPKATTVEFFLDDETLEGEPLFVDTEEPFELRLDTSGLEEGIHTVTAVVLRVKGKSESTTIEEAVFTVDHDAVGEAPVASSEFDLRADPAFSEDALAPDARMWYRRVWAAIENPDARYDLGALASSGSIRTYGYDLNQQLSLVITALRASQDPALVDLIAELSDRMADELVTKWYDRSRDTYYTPDDGTAGYRRFLYLDSGKVWDGLDTQILSTVLAHGLIANMAYTLHANRDVPSPSGIDYGAKADFWIDYLKNDFEAIWRIRSGAEWPEFPLWTHPISHSWKSQMRWSYYMYKLTGEQPYLDSAEAYAQHVLDETYAVDTPLGEGVVWSHKLSDSGYGIQPVAYSRYGYGIESDLALEGGLAGIDAEYMAKHARTFAHFVLDNGATDMAFDVGGMRDRTGRSLGTGRSATIPTRDPWTGSSLEYRRESVHRFKMSYYAPLAHFAERKHIATIAEEIYADVESSLENPRNLAIPVGMLLVSAGR